MHAIGRFLALTSVAIAAAALVAVPHAWPAPPPGKCNTPASERADVHSVDPDASVTFYTGIGAQTFLAAVIDVFDFDPAMFDGVETVGLYVWSDPHYGIEIRLFGADGCDGGGSPITAKSLAKIKQLLGTGA